MKKWLSDVWESIKWVLVAPIIHYLDCRQENIDGSFDKYWARKNARAARKERRNGLDG